MIRGVGIQQMSTKPKYKKCIKKNSTQSFKMSLEIQISDFSLV